MLWRRSWSAQLSVLAVVGELAPELLARRAHAESKWILIRHDKSSAKSYVGCKNSSLNLILFIRLTKILLLNHVGSAAFSIVRSIQLEMHTPCVCVSASRDTPTYHQPRRCWCLLLLPVYNKYLSTATLLCSSLTDADDLTPTNSKFHSTTLRHVLPLSAGSLQGQRARVCSSITVA